MADSPSPLAQGEETGPMIKQLPVSLEDLFYGTKVRVTFRRKVWEEKRRRWTEEEHDVEVPIYKGLKPGSRVKFRGEGDIGPGGVERDLHFVVVERSHPTFTRHSLDLHCTLDVPLADALCGWSLTMTSICGKAVTVSHPGPTPTGWIERRTGLGMCDYRRPEERGDLVLEVHVVWPEGQLGEGQKKMVRAALKDL
ncbi:hypothetical protein EJ06DRAFT_526403 [Trichodelitschia bisporula]|uniref:Chaperone DnaJ C-terminal domain-containing protein n=1 Tax=Trichodelitschia bisporula TaxID=703511 RepID=A0A6G1I7T0_9PEZI|nr:hypothetical protein EJ06DRAFT_526403 [Trichodelitschia bisporula]